MVILPRLKVNEPKKKSKVSPLLVCLRCVPERVCSQTHKSQRCHKCLRQISDNSPRQVFAPPCETTAALFLTRSKMRKVKEASVHVGNRTCVCSLFRCCCVFVCHFNFLVISVSASKGFWSPHTVFPLQVPVHVFLDFSTLECKHLSECAELFVLDLMDATANYTNREVKVQ